MSQSSPAMRASRIVLFLALVGLSAQAQTNSLTPRDMSMEDCIDIALKHNLDVQIKRYNPELSRYALGALYGAYDPAFSISAEHDHRESAGGVDAQGRFFSGNQIDSDNFSTGL